jgi:branched-chain amino acid aminotransferase
MEEFEKIWIDGEFVNWKEAKVHILSHAIHYGSAVFEGIRAYKTKKGMAIFRLREHIGRLFYSASSLSIEVPFSPEQIQKVTLDLVKINGVGESYIRPVVFLGYGKMGLNPNGAPVQAAIANWPWGAYLGGENPIKVVISKYIRPHPRSTEIGAKISGSYFNSILASLDAQKRKADEALLLDFEGFVAEGPGENIFMVKAGVLYTPSPGAILTGITRNSVIEIAKDLGIKVEEKKITPEEIKSADEAFFTGTAVEICPIGEIDGVLINNRKVGVVTQKIKESYSKIVRGEDKRYLNWLTFV